MLTINCRTCHGELKLGVATTVMYQQWSDLIQNGFGRCHICSSPDLDLISSEDLDECVDNMKLREHMTNTLQEEIFSDKPFYIFKSCYGGSRYEVELSQRTQFVLSLYYSVYNYGAKEPKDLPEIDISCAIEALQTLTTRELFCLWKYHGECKSYAEIGELIGVGGTRISQINKKAYRKLRHPSRSYQVIIRTSRQELISAKDKKIQEQSQLIQGMIEDIDRYHRLCPDFAEDPQNNYKCSNENIPLEDLDFTVRTYNCLKRAGKDFVRNILDMEESDFSKIRNLGRKSAEEIIEKIRKLGYPDFPVTSND